MKHIFRFHGRRKSEMAWEMADDEEWHHLLNVSRVGIGEVFELCDGRGSVATARLVSKEKKHPSFEVVSESLSVRLDEKNCLAIAIGALKPQSLDELIPGLVELGVDRILVYLSRGVEKSRANDVVRERWRRMMISSCKQAKRDYWPEIEWYADLGALISASSSYETKLLMDHEASVTIAELTVPTGRVVAVVGSEKGLDPDERDELASSGFIPARLEGFVLRAVTAAIATTCLLRHFLSTPLNSQH